LYRSFSRLCLGLFFLIILAVTLSAGEMKLNSDTMEYDPDEGKIYASGNVKFSRDQLDVFAQEAEGRVDGSFAMFRGNVRGEGELNGEEVDFTCDILDGGFNEPAFYGLKGNVDARIGSKHIIAEIVTLSGSEIEAEKIEHFRDEESGITASGRTMEGTLKDDVIEDMIINDNVRIILEGNHGTDTIVTGERAVYSRERGTLVVTGSAKAVQKDRTITADSLVVFPETERIEASGEPRIIFRVKEGDQ